MEFLKFDLRPIKNHLKRGYFPMFCRKILPTLFKYVKNFACKTLKKTTFSYYLLVRKSSFNIQKKMLVLCMIFLGVASFSIADEEQRLIRSIQAHLTIKDYSSAVQEAQQALSCYPNSASLHEGFIRSLAKAGEEKKLIEAWESYSQLFPDKEMNRELIEEMAWGILNKAFGSYSIIMREMALLAAYFSEEAKGAAILKQGMRDSNYAVRTVAVKLAGHFRDHQLVEEVKRLFKVEKVWAVRQQVIESIGKMKIKGLKPELEALIASEESLAKEKALAIASLLELIDTINRPDIERLASSNRAGLRQMACQAIAHFQSRCNVDQLFRLVEDPHPDVRLEAFQAFGKLKPEGEEEKIITVARRGVKDLNYNVALSAAWLLTLYSPKEGCQIFQRLMNDHRKEVRSLAAAALAATGSYGISLTIEQFQTHSDPFVRLNLALGLIGQRQVVEESAHYLRQMLVWDKLKWNSIDVGLFRAIVDASLKRSSDSLTTPEAENQMLRLELLNLCAILNTPETQQAIRGYLLERSWEISATAAALLLTECDESAIELVQELLQDQNPRVRLQAALILALWSREESAIQALEEGYDHVDWETKTKILEGIGRVGSTKSVPFLIKVLKEPSQTLRLIAAMAMIQCLNH